MNRSASCNQGDGARLGREKSIWQIRRSRFCRVELRQVMTARTRIAVGIAGVLLWAPVLVGAYVAITDGESALLGGLPVFIAQLAVTIANLCALFMAISSPSRAFTSERDQGTLEALVLTSMSRKEVVWSKFWARTAAMRTFVWLSAPIYVLLGAVFGYVIFADIADYSRDLYGPMVVIGMVVLVTLLFGIQLFAYHCVAALAVYISARSRSTLKASVVSFGLVGVAVFCAGVPGTLVTCILGPVLLRQLIRNFDRYLPGD